MIYYDYDEVVVNETVYGEWDEDDPGEDCAFIYWTGKKSLTFRTGPCDRPAYYICQRPSGETKTFCALS